MDRKIENKSIIPRKYRIYVLAGVLITGVVSWALFTGTSSAYRVDKETLTITEVLDAPFHDYINVRGIAEPAYRVYLDAVEGGIVEKIHKEEGEMVNKGDTILVLSNLNLSLNILNSEAQLAEKANFLRETQLRMEQQKLSLERDITRLEYDLKQAEREYQQNRTFFKEELISKNKFLESEEAYQLAVKLNRLSLERLNKDATFRKTQIEKIQQNLQNMERNLKLIYQRQNHLTVKAVVKGQLATLNAVPGQSIAAGYRFGQLNELSNYKLQASIDEHYIDRIRKGLSVNMKRQGEHYQLKVSKVYPEVNEGQFLIDLAFEGAVPNNIRSGQSYPLNIELGDTKQAILIKRGAFFQSSGGRWVYVLTPDGDKAVKRKIRIGQQNPKYYEVLEGLKAGDRVITSTYDLFGDNDNLLLD